MGFPYDKADWSVVDGAMFMGAGSTMPFFYTIIAIVICIVFLIYGQMIENDKYNNLSSRRARSSSSSTQ
jgi:hypothetical protein